MIEFGEPWCDSEQDLSSFENREHRARGQSQPGERSGEEQRGQAKSAIARRGKAKREYMDRGSLGVLKDETLVASRIESAEQEAQRQQGRGARAIEGSESEKAKEEAKQKESREEGRRQSADEFATTDWSKRMTP